MRPLTLIMTAFGPFSGTETIRFTDLGENPLFLINGPTGSGKTTILDAICFALYGKTTGDEREGAQMRCDLSAADTLTEVTLEFRLSGRRFRIRRVPEQQRPKSRGEGTTTQAPEAQLVELQGDGLERLIVSSKVSEATREIEELTGLSVDQFRQVMVLPQGKFRQLLMAESNEREKIFSQLFQTSIYKALEENLRSRSAKIRQDRERQQQLRQGILEGADLESAEALETELTTRAREAEDALRLKTDREKAYVASGRAQQLALDLEKAFVELERLEAGEANLQTQKECVAGKRLRLTAAEEALKLKPVFDERSRSQKALQSAETGLALAAEARDRAQVLLAQAEEERQSAEKLSEPLDAAKQEVVRLEGLRARATRLAEARQTREQAGGDVKTAQARLQHSEATLQETMRQREAAEQKQTDWQNELSTLGDKQLQEKLLADQLASRREIDTLQRQLARHRAELEKGEALGRRLLNEHEAQSRHARSLELAWHQGQAAILAAELQTGQPCPVCGSSEHPAPARSEAAIPSEKELEQARVRAQETSLLLSAAREAYGEIRGKVGHAQKQLDDLQIRLGESSQLPVDQLQSHHARLKQEVAALQARRREFTVLTDALKQLKEGEAEARKARDLAASQAAETTTALEKARTRVQDAEQELPEHYRPVGALDAAIARTRVEAGELEQRIAAAGQRYKEAHGRWEAAGATLVAAEQARQRAQEELASAQSRRDEALAASPFADEQSYGAALLDEAQVATLRQAVADYDQQCQRIAGAVEQQRAAVEGRSRPDLQRTEAELLQAEEAKNAALTLWQHLDGRRQLLEATRSKLEKAARDQAELDRRYAVIGTLSDVANGQTGKKISLQRFVLSVLLDDVLIEAGHRLSLMSKGRYQLLRKEDRSKGNKASGLELEVEDAYTGKVRAVATLSGGESFMAALSMALGLSDVVQAYAGGIRLDTLFIDEGFGSLDAESLDLAVRTLIDLQASGRMIGIISHVAELKEQMPLRLDVISGRDGSRVRLVTP
ncbi:DNA repair exonuclease SbcCD ATPase subunit [Desulfuromonas soudanensis]|uniref:DNA repair exonuclease SbcCD ATPase subunit n=1 Tax=Desulfuromonas soudanensis TaxID=1603606 RepID=A0A0M4DIX4_9BACT|nr:SMC family ATPase [Desulfuromonas soudanensis]ALC17237.1 DNA repair exonuclease SbcCD ATPase subunit [Desulfuromonas soudanensis]